MSRRERIALSWHVYTHLSLSDWLCLLGLRGCDTHIRSDFYVPFWRDPRRWLYR